MAFGENHDNSAARAARQALIEAREAATEIIGGGAIRIQPDLPPGTGWTMQIVGKSWTPKWYLKTRELCIASTDRYLDRVGSFKQL